MVRLRRSCQPMGPNPASDGVERGGVCGVQGGEFFDELPVFEPAGRDDGFGDPVADGEPFHPRPQFRPTPAGASSSVRVRQLTIAAPMGAEVA